jgi:hypothetical protein
MGEGSGDRLRRMGGVPERSGGGLSPEIRLGMAAAERGQH